eukprot:GEMP01006369.1.p1 GENE.GEMP01006369.1~~GEMP01006369.1.p1  ORF type:complete len:528 (+),score=127.60 GEMP01006369.1:76-1659(+)
MAHASSPPRETRFVSNFVTHRRLRLLCEALDVASAILVDGVIAASSDEADKAFIALRRGALDALRLKDEEGAYEAHFVKMTQQMTRADIELLWKYLLDYVRKRGRPISKRPIVEAVTAFLELAQGTSWRPVLDLLLPTAELSPEFDEVFRAEVVIKPREIRKREESPTPSANGSNTATANVALSDTSPTAKSTSAQREEASPARPGQTPTSTYETDAVTRGRVLIEARPKEIAANLPLSYKDSVRRFSAKKHAHQESAVPARSSQSGGAVPSKAERPSVKPISHRPPSAVDTWWENSPPQEHLQVTPSSASVGLDCWWNDAGDEDPSAHFAVSGMPPSGPIAEQQPRTGAAGSNSFAGFANNGARVAPTVMPEGSHFARYAPEKQRQQPAMAAMHSAVPQQPLARMGQPPPGSMFSNAQSGPIPYATSAPSSQVPSPVFGAIGVAGADAFADLGHWCDDIAPFPENEAADGTGEKKKKKKKKKVDKDEDAGEIPKLRGPRNSGKPRNSGTESSLWDDSTGPFSMFRG